MPELSEPPEGYQSVKGVKSSEEQPSFFKVSDLHTLPPRAKEKESVKQFV